MLRRRLIAFFVGTDGVASATSLYMLVGMLMVGGLAVDYSNAMRAQARLQAVADSVAMSAAMHLPDPDAARTIALDVSEKNTPVGQSSRLEINAEDIQIGIWDRATRTFQPSNLGPNAVVVTARNASQNGNALSTLLLRLVGINRINVEATAVGFRPPPPCTGAGYFSREKTVVINSNRFSENFCLHGEQGVTLNNVNTFDPGTTISMPDLTDFVAMSNNYGAEDALRRRTHSFARLDALPEMMSAMRAGSIHAANLPDHINSGPVYLNSISPNTELLPGTLYIVKGNVNLGTNIAIWDVAIVASGTIRINSNTSLANVVLASDGEITVNTNNYVGETAHEYCRTGRYSSYILSRGNISFGSNNTLRGVMMLANGEIDTGNNNEASDGIYAEADGRISLGNANSNAGCPEGLEREVGPENLREVIPSMVF